MNAFSNRGRIARQLILYTVLFSSLITLVETAVQIYGEYRRDISGIDHRLEQIKTSYLQGITEAVWVADHTQLQLMLEGIQALQDIEYAGVVVDDRVYVSSGELHGHNVITLETDLLHDYRGVQQTIGHFTVQADLEAVYLRLWNRLWIILVSNAIKTFLVALFIYTLFDKLVTRHLHRIAEYAESHDLSQPSEELTLERKAHKDPGSDELDLVVSALNQMQQNLRRSFDDLHASERQVRLLLESTAEAIVGIDLEGRCIFVNPACLRMLGYRDGSELVGRTVPSIIRPAGEPLSPAECVVCQASLSGEVGHSDKEVFWTSDGRAIPVEWWSHPIMAEGRITGSVVAFIDITARKTAEQEIRNYRDNLEKLVAERTEALESFSYSVSHDLRSPLRSINGFSQLLLEEQNECLNEEGRGYLQRIMAATRRMARLIDDLLQLSRLSRHDIKLEAVDLSEVAMKVIEELKQQSLERTVDVVIKPAVWVTGDSGLLRIAMENLLGNAWKYSGQTEQAHIEFGSTTIDGQVCYYVRDNGVGFDMQYVDKLFGAFQRLHGEEFEGTGIGLVTVERVIRRHGGRIWAEGRRGEGATFYFTLRGVEAATAGVS